MLAALGSLTMQKRFLENVLPKDQGFQSDYAGIFHFRVCILCCIGTAGIWLVGLHRGQNCSPRSRHLCMLWFFSAESQFRIFQKTPSFLMGPHAPGGTIKLQGIWSPFLKVMTYAQLQSYSYQLFEQICVHTYFERHSEVCFDFDFLLWLSMHLWFLSILTFSIFQYTSVCPFSWWYLLEITNPGKQMRWMEI